MVTKKTSSSGTTRSRKKTTPENGVSTPGTPVSTTGGGGTAVALARETKTPISGTPNFRHPAELQERVRQRAYELFQKRGGQHGFDVEDWLKAEAELTPR